ncbi:MAG: DUF494 family protein [Enterobacteriaceae bacterium]
MFDVLMYLFESYIHSEQEVHVDQQELTVDLTQAGFHRDDIYRALSWLDKLASLHDTDDQPYLRGKATEGFRIYTEREMMRLDADCRGLLLYLEQIKIIGPDTREMIIDRVMELDIPHFDLSDLKWVVLMVLFNLPGQENSYQQIELLLQDAQQRMELYRQN